MECRYSAIQTLGTLDGPGVRFVLFLQGCPLRCGYCHNPETRDASGGKTATVKDIMEKVLRCRNYFGKNGGITVSGGEPLMQAKFVTELFKECKRQGINTCLDTSGCIMKAVITVIGRDTVGVVAKVSAVCAELNINIEDVSQSIMQDMFCMIMLVDLSKANAGASEVRDRFAALGKEMKMQVTVTRQEVFDAMHTI